VHFNEFIGSNTWRVSVHGASDPKDMNLPGLELHHLKGSRKDTWSVKVSGVTMFRGKNAEDVDYEDYH
jgi:proteic killer suppression protein